LGPGHHSVTRSGDQNLKDFQVMTRKIEDNNLNLKEDAPVKRSSGKELRGNKTDKLPELAISRTWSAEPKEKGGRELLKLM